MAAVGAARKRFRHALMCQWRMTEADGLHHYRMSYFKAATVSNDPKGRVDDDLVATARRILIKVSHLRRMRSSHFVPMLFSFRNAS